MEENNMKRIALALNENELKALEEEADKYQESVYMLMKRKVLDGLKVEPVKKGRPKKYTVIAVG